MNISFSLPLVGYQTRCSSWKVHAAQTTVARLPQSTLVLVRRRLAHDRATQGSISPLHRVAFFKRRHPDAPCALMKLATWLACYSTEFQFGIRQRPGTRTFAYGLCQQPRLIPLHQPPASLCHIISHALHKSQKPSASGV